MATNSPSSFLQALSYYNLVGGGIGLVILALNLPDGNASTLKLGSLLFAAAAFILSIASFFAYRERQNPTLMGIYAIVQLPVIRYAGFKYALSNGIFLVAGLDADSNLLLKLEAIYHIQFSLSLTNKEVWFFGVNAVSVVTLFYLLKRYQWSDAAA